MHSKLNFKILTDDFTDVYPGNKYKYCKNWLVNYYQLQFFTNLSLIYVFILNYIVGYIYEALGPFSKFKTVNEETQSIYIKTLIFQFLDFALVPILLQFNFDIKWLNRWGIFKGPYTDFTPEWFRDIGDTLVMTMVLNAIIPSLLEYIGWAIMTGFRCCDRGCRKRLKKANTEDGVNTDLLVQEELEELYTGEPMYA